MATFVIKASSVSNAGNGVFVTKDYNKGDYVCFYDGEDVDITDQDEYSMGHPTNPNMTRKGFRDVRTPDGVAQFINDGAALLVNIFDDYCPPTLKIMYNFIDVYKTISAAKCNVMFGDMNFGMYATKNIKAGDELFFSYGADYWLSRIAAATDKPLVRLMISMLCGDIELQNNKLYWRGQCINEKIAIGLIHAIGLSVDSAMWDFFHFQKKSALLKLSRLFVFVATGS
jgi:hypothetical protein